MGPTKKKSITKLLSSDGWQKKNSVFFSFYSLSLPSQIHENLTVGIRRDKHEKCCTRRGLRVGSKNKGFHREFRKNSEKSKFLVFLRFTAF